MRKLALMLMAAALGGCSCGEEVRDAAVRLELSFSGFHPGCLRVVAQDAADPSLQRETEVAVVAGERTGTRTVAVYREANWSRELTVRAIAHEGSCTGPQVAQQEQTVHLPAGEIQPMSLALSAVDSDEDGYVAPGNGGTDCNDGDGAVHPTAIERCNAIDDDCDGPVDEDTIAGRACEAGGCPGITACQPDATEFCAVPANSPVFPDADDDGHGATGSGSFEVCALWGPDAGQSATADDCDDLRADVYPGAPERCDGVDNTCEGTVDEGFSVGNPCDPGDGNCPGLIVCDGTGSATCAGSGPPAAQYLDDDLDGQGAGASLGTSCEPAQRGVSLVATDCDDGNPLAHQGGTEVCDGTDNDCDGTADQGGVCAAPPSFKDSTVGGGAQDWISVTSWADGGTGVWIAGVSDELRVRLPGASSFTDLKDDCIAVTWEGAWADPRTGEVYLAGRDGVLARHAPVGTGCTVLDAGVANSPLSSVHGFERGGSQILYAVNEAGLSVAWDGGTSVTNLPQVSGAPCLEDVHGLSPQLTFAVGGDTCDFGAAPRIFRLDPATGAWTPQELSGAGLPDVKLTSVHVVNERLAYAVGGNPLTDEVGITVWNGTSWGPHSVPPGATWLTAVIAFGRTAVFVAGGTEAYGYLADAGWQDLYTNPDSDLLWDISGTSPANVWIVGDDGTVAHWPN